MKHDDFEKKFDRHFKMVWGIMIVWLVVALGVIGTLGYVAFHFLGKVW